MPARHVHEARLDVPVVEVNSEGQIVSVSSGKSGFNPGKYLEALQTGTIAVPTDIATHSEDTIAASLSGTEPYDLNPYDLVAGTTYTFSYRGTAEGGIVDPYLALFGPDFAYITEDDDGGFGRTSQITFTPTEDGTYYLYSTSWYTLAYGDPSIDTGNYTIDVWTESSDHDAPSTIEGAVVIDVGTTYAYLNEAGDVDVYAVNVTAGLGYAFVYNGGIDSGGDWDDEPGESIGIVELLDGDGNVVASFANYETGVSFVAPDDGTYYVRISGLDPEMTGGYTLDVEEIDLSTRDPLESLNWDSAANIPTVLVDDVPTAYVYFAPAGENFGETAPDGSPMITYGWTQKEMDAVMLALEQYTPITGINYVITTDADQATFRFLTTANQPGTPGNYGAYAYPQAPEYGDAAGILVFNVNSGGWDKPGVSIQDIPGDQVSLDQGGFSFAVILHELGHAHGIAHPHDTGGGSEVLAGVYGSTGSFGFFDLNQGVYTVMSYNDAWELHPDGPSAFTIAGIDNGWSGTLSAFDIAVLQARYGVHEHNEGDTVYTLSDVADDAFYQTIWDSGGNDTIAYGGDLDAHIDLTAATLDYSATGGGVISFLYNEQPLPPAPGSFLVRGGFTIANGVVIENASGGSGDDVLIGNAANNILSGNAGNDTIYGGDGLDVITLGDGDDTFVAEVGLSKIALKGPNKGSMSLDIITDFDASGDDVIDLSGLGTFTFGGTDANKAAGTVTYKTFDSVNGAEKALGFDIDGQNGAGGISGPVTVVYGNTDGGSSDFAIVLLNTSGVESGDFLLG